MKLCCSMQGFLAIKIKAAIVRSLAAAFQQRIMGTVYESPLMPWLAIEGINSRSLTFAEPEYFCHKLFGIIYTMRITLTGTANPTEQAMDAVGFRECFRRTMK